MMPPGRLNHQVKPIVADIRHMSSLLHRTSSGPHYIKDCFEVLGALDDAASDASTSSSSALAAGQM